MAGTLDMRKGDFIKGCPHTTPACTRCVEHREELVQLRRAGLTLNDPPLRSRLDRYLEQGRRLLGTSEGPEYRSGDVAAVGGSAQRLRSSTGEGVPGEHGNVEQAPGGRSGNLH